MNFLHARQQFQVADVEFNSRPHRSQHRHARASGPVHLEARLHQVVNHLLNLALVRGFLHGNNHRKAFSSQLFASSLPWLC